MLPLQLLLLPAGTSRERPCGKPETCCSRLLDVVPTDLFSQFAISIDPGAASALGPGGLGQLGCR